MSAAVVVVMGSAMLGAISSPVGAANPPMFVESTIQQPPLGTIPIVGNFKNTDGHLIDDILWYGRGTVAEKWWFGADSGTFTKPTTGNPTINSSFNPFAGDFNRDGNDDIFWYAPGTGADYLWLGIGDGTFNKSTVSPTINGKYQPLVGDFDSDGSTDVLWYSPGTGGDYLWYGWDNAVNPGVAFARTTPRQINGVYDFVTAGDFNVDGSLDVMWWSHTSKNHPVWLYAGGRTFNLTSKAGPAVGSLPMVMNLDDTGASDIFWYGSGTIADGITLGSPVNTFTAKAINGSFDPLWGNFDGDNTNPVARDDILWWSTANGGTDYFARGTGTGAPVGVPYTNRHQDWLTHYPALGYFNYDNALDILFNDPYSSSNPFYFGIDAFAGFSVPRGPAVSASEQTQRPSRPALRGAVCPVAYTRQHPTVCNR